MNLYYKNKYSTIIFCMILCLSLGSFFPARVINAEQDIGPSISVAPHTFNLTAFEGEEIKKKIKIYNRGDAAIPLKIRVADFDAEDETGRMIEAGAESLFNSWFEFEKQNFIIDPQKTEEVNFSVKIPADAKLQGYYAVIFIETDISTYIYNESKLQVIPGLGIPFMLKVGEENVAEPLSVLEYSVANKNRLEKTEKALNFFVRSFSENQDKIAVVNSNEPSFIVKLKNNSPYHSKLSGKIKLSGLGWKLNNELEFPSVTILPGKTRQVLVENKSEEEISLAYPEKGEIKWANLGIHPANAAASEADRERSSLKTGFGLMRAELDLQSEEGISKNESRWIFVFSWWIPATLLIIAILLIIFFFSARKIYKMRKLNILPEKSKREKKRENKSPILPGGYNYFSAKEKKSAEALTDGKKDVQLTRPISKKAEKIITDQKIKNK